MEDTSMIGPIISSLVSLFSVYATYRTAVEQAGVKAEHPPQRTEEVARGEAVATLVAEAISRHGSEDEQADLDNFLRNPQRYADQMTHVMREVLTRTPDVARELQILAQQSAIVQPGGSAVNIDNKAPNQGQQGVFNAPVTLNNQSKQDDNS